MPENDKGFTVTDHRLFQQDEQGGLRENRQPESADQQPAGERTQSKPDDPGRQRNPPPVEFGSFIISLTHAAMMHLGHLEDPQGNPVERNLDLARHTIDTLAMLKDKTKGNLNQEEQSLLDGILAELRMLYVQTRKNSN